MPVDMDELETHQTAELQNSDAIKRACDQCRVRKIRCGRETPTCSNCRTANRPCSSTGIGARPKEPRQRVLISQQYERKIDSMDTRLGRIENMLQNLTASFSKQQSLPATSESVAGTMASNQTGSTPATHGTDAAAFAPDDSDGDSEFAGDSSMRAQTEFAGEVLESLVTRTSLHEFHPDMQSALSSLKQIVDLQHRQGAHDSRFAHAKQLPNTIRDMPMPSYKIVLEVLREVKNSPPASFPIICAFIAVEDFNERCRRVFFPTEDYTLTLWGTVNAGLYFLFQERAAAAKGARAAQLTEALHLCRDNFETVLTNLPLVMPARRESVELLLLGCLYSIETSKYSIARDFNTMAANLCMSLGYHRLRTPSTSEQDSKIVLFWFSYILDRALSLRFGRAAIIQDCDITAPRRISDTVKVPNIVWKMVLDQWIAYAEFQGLAYKQLYSPAALTRSPEQRVESARRLVNTILKLVEEQEPLIRHVREKIQNSGFDATSLFSFDMAILADSLVHGSALTLIYRAIPSPPGSPSTFNPECIEAARRAFASHEQCMAMAGESLFVKAGYIQWNIIHVPFIPLIVLFCHIVETSNLEDFERLTNFVNGLQPVCAVSEPVGKLHRVSQVLLNVANLCIKTRIERQQNPQNQDMTMAEHNIDMYLNQLGFMPQYVPQQTAPLYEDSEMPVAADFDAYQATQLGNWFSGNTHILGLLEEGLSEFDPNMWSAPGQ
ncbi:hypothetical protein QBC42DRAFT_333594 [Cladorrhinum samala]|uniref:Zn(2)-C6 fungal-type domain-containing protein n=1 Tax=Cladorrhinum samala TaxID=585594 RepID=A0AAV9HK60_9PEZI|nr:hypothetical protein QBC42DRAFT_333594 [Cladorrhinum samala]